MAGITQRYDYRAGMSSQCSEAIRLLRREGWAVSVIKPEVVGQPHNRSRIETTMTMAGVRRAEELKHMNYGGVR